MRPGRGKGAFSKRLPARTVSTYSPRLYKFCVNAYAFALDVSFFVTFPPPHVQQQDSATCSLDHSVLLFARRRFYNDGFETRIEQAPELLYGNVIREGQRSQVIVVCAASRGGSRLLRCRR